MSGPSPLPEAAREFALPGPFPVGRYAARLRDQLRSFTRVQLSGEISGLRPPTRTRAYFELRDADGAIPCSMWRDDWERLGELTGSLADGVAVVVAGGCDYYPGSASASPAFSFSVKDLRIAGEGDLLAQIAQRRRALAADGLLELQGALSRAILPRTIGVVCGEGAKAGDDLLAAFARRGWRGRIVWAFAPVQDRHAAPRKRQDQHGKAAGRRVRAEFGLEPEAEQPPGREPVRKRERDAATPCALHGITRIPFTVYWEKARR